MQIMWFKLSAWNTTTIIIILLVAVQAIKNYVLFNTLKGGQQSHVI